MTIDSSCCIYIDMLVQVETSITKIRQQATWPQQTLDHHSPMREWEIDL